MSDELNNLEEMDIEYTPDEMEVMNEYFPAPSAKSTSSTNWKFIGYTTLLYILISNEYFDSLLNKFNICRDNSTYKTIAKTIIFFILFFFIDRYLS